MIPWETLDKARMPKGGSELVLARRGGEYSIRVNGCELMNSRAHGSEEALAELALAKVSTRKEPRVLVGGLGMGFTLAEALKHVGEKGQVVVAELVPAVVEWNRTHLGELAGHPLKDKRSLVREDDVALVIRERQGAFDAILLDVDNGPEGLTWQGNDWLYSQEGLAMTHAALRPGGVLAVWSVSTHRAYTKRLLRAGFSVKEARARARGREKGVQHTIWIARRPS